MDIALTFFSSPRKRACLSSREDERDGGLRFVRLRRLPRVEMTRWRRAFDSCTVNSGRQHTNTIAAPFLSGSMGVVELGRIPVGLGIKGPMPGLEPGAGGGSGPGPELPRVWATAPGSLSAARVRANAGTSKPLVARWAPGLPPCDGGSPSGSHEMRRAHSLAAVDIPRLTPRVQARVSPCSSAAPRPRRPLPKWHHVPGLARLRLDNMRYAAKGACASQLDANANTSARPCPASVPPRIGVQCAWKPASTCGIAADGRRTTGTR